MKWCKHIVWFEGFNEPGYFYVKEMIRVFRSPCKFCGAKRPKEKK